MRAFVGVLCLRSSRFVMRVGFALSLFGGVLGAGTRAAHALPPGGEARGFVEGANHHLGDASFVAAFGRAPDARDGEALRMHTHLTFVRAWLAGRPATRPEFEARRAELLEVLDRYIAKGVTPLNLDAPWRGPVFVDALGHVCAVGYLIEQTAGRALVERIAGQARFELLEDIAAALPEVRAWVDGSGFTLDELASIQPGYMRPALEEWQRWDLGAKRPADGPWVASVGEVTTRGSWRRGQMEGEWTRSDAAGRAIGRGTMKGGAGTWTSLDAGGREIAEGPFVASRPEGMWRLFHPSGRVAAEGRMRRGVRNGTWTFFHDVDGAVPVARGRFGRDGGVIGTWRHFDRRGAAIAETWSRSARFELVLAMREVGRTDGVAHELVEGTFGGDFARVDLVTVDGERFYVEADWEGRRVYDVRGRELVRGEGADQVVARGPGWSERVARAARRGDVEAVRRALRPGDGDPQVAQSVQGDGAQGVTTEAVSAQTMVHLDRALAALDAVRTPTPDDIKVLASAAYPGSDDGEPGAEGDTALPKPPRSLEEIIAGGMTWYVEWPHIDQRFEHLYATLPGHYAPGTAPLDEGDMATVAGIPVR